MAKVYNRRRKPSHPQPSNGGTTVPSSSSSPSPSSSPTAVTTAATAGSSISDNSSTTSTIRRLTHTKVVNQIDARPHLESAKATPSTRSNLFKALSQATIPHWLQSAVMISLIFGGCCSNVFALEAIIKKEPGSGHLITLAQFLLVAAEGFIYHFDPTSPTLIKKNQIPIYRWIVQIMLFFSVSVLNNHAFDYNISVPVHIILRSGGSMTTLVIGWLWGKKYSRLQVFSVLILTAGIIVSALGDANGMGESEATVSRFIAGLTILFVAQVLSAFMGLYIEATYTKYGNNYREALFYTHALSLVLFVPFAKDIKSQWRTLSSSEPLPLQPYAPQWLNDLIVIIPRHILFLTLNAVTQYVCIRGVNMLGSVSTALTVTIVLNIRKLVSLLLSIWLFGNKLHPKVLMGAAVVFTGGFLYGIESQRQSQLRRKQRRE